MTYWPEYGISLPTAQSAEPQVRYKDMQEIFMIIDKEDIEKIKFYDTSTTLDYKLRHAMLTNYHQYQTGSQKTKVNI